MTKRKPKRVAFYVRTSTKGKKRGHEQTTANQKRELNAVAKQQSWRIVKVFEDNGISGAKGRNERPGLDQLLKAVARSEVDMVAVWSVDRLGRSLTDLLHFLTEIHEKDVDLYLHQQGLDTSSPSGRAMFQMMGVFAEFERAMIRERVMAGMARAREEGTKIGRPTISDTKKAAILHARKSMMGITAIAAALNVGVGTVRRVINGQARRPDHEMNSSRK